MVPAHGYWHIFRLDLSRLAFLRGTFWSTHLSSLSSSSWHILITCSHYSTTLKHSPLRKWILIITVTACEIKFILSSHKCLSPEDPKTRKKDSGCWDEDVQNASTNLNYDGPWSLSQLRIGLTVKRRLLLYRMNSYTRQGGKLEKIGLVYPYMQLAPPDKMKGKN